MIGGLQARCGQCKEVVIARKDVVCAVYPDQTVVWIFTCPECGKRTTRKDDGGGYYSSTVQTIAERAGFAVTRMPERESPVECDFPPFDLDNLIDLHEQMDNVISKLCETDG